MTDKMDKKQEPYRFNELMSFRDMAEIIVDAIIDGGIVQKVDFKKAVDITDDEIMV